MAAPDSAPSRPPQATKIWAPSSAARSMLSAALRSANRRTSRSLLVKPPSRKTGWREQVRGHHRHDQAGLVERLRAAARGAASFVAGVGAEREDVVVVEGDAVGAELGEPVDRLGRVERRADRAAEHVDALPADRPQAEGEPVLAGRGEVAAIGALIGRSSDVVSRFVMSHAYTIVDRATKGRWTAGRASP